MWWPLFIWATTTTLLMLSVTNVFWEYLPKLKFVQLPWRWLVPLNVVFAITVAAAVRRKSGRVVVFALIAVWMFTLSSRVLPPWWDTAQDVEAIHRSIVKGAGYEGTDEYVPRGADPYEIKSDAARVEILSPATGNVNINDWRAESRAFTVDVSQPAQLALKLFNYPAWRVEVNGCAIETATRDVTGQMLISVPAGASEVAVRFTRTRDRKVGIAVSAVTGLLLIVIGVIGARSRREPKLNR